MFVKSATIFTIATLCVVNSFVLNSNLENSPLHRMRRYTFGSFGSGGFGSGSIGSFGPYSYKPDPFTFSSFSQPSFNTYSAPPKFNFNLPPPQPILQPFAFSNTSPLGTYEKAGVALGPISGSVSQSIDRFGKPSPQKFDFDANFKNPDTGAGVDFGLSKTPSVSGSASVGGSLNLHHSDTSNLNAVAKHTEHFDKDWSNVGKSNMVGLEYKNKEKDLTVGVGASHVEPKYGEPSTNVVATIEKKF